MDDWRNGGFGLYVHWPFCQAKCPYCDFNSHVTANIDQSVWVKAYQSELARVSGQLQGRVLNSIFFGGGTPSLMHPDTVAAVIEAARDIWPFANDIEISLEANPGSVEAGRFAGYRDAGVNRISMGIQALNDADLRRLGRIHSVAEAKAAFDIARNCFDRVSFDLIYARQGQTPQDWQAELTEALSMSIDHLSLYQLTIEESTAFGDRYARGKLRDLPSDDSAADMYQLTQDICAAHGMPAYEVSNHAVPGAESRHNLIYWRYGDYVGIGPGAHGRITLDGARYATETHRAPGAWLQAVSNGSGENLREALEREDAAVECLMMGMRLREGLDMERYAQLSGTPLNADKLQDLAKMGMISISGQRLHATDKGRAVLNAILRDLLVD
ncbi:radical SAM family heme chaperone HemW [Phaeobacter gallaeciensis]|uniref:radical SAM family heme chaperone HemW n=1 Tax=Phaeobacter gallaeciensis TaxID=60890 RepID=UPI00237F33A3|nr:radical SAM family heme chaperone HemW [Phaeobacter gallaeciensis]MDE4192130.1 radical SAM family heme chaperone HemW [Phaeobacter gallaeciensis]MDE4200593.1 radical SAM family heme chaperone HemW [Phaeobacter gallaeciensis]MDE4204746.1 radical SAM family heme chaperone HemW [Phaeobacter gallaeciensis]MDE4208885.1 radical SAM family heme chaperone HemW [Phaeobacter gallaeciensis]MDE4217044.1 radical SAM family heme chaperone HemW [Phaeobacter gallaeciensis]